MLLWCHVLYVYTRTSVVLLCTPNSTHSTGVALQLKGSYVTPAQHVARVGVGLTPVGQSVSGGGTLQLTPLVGCGLSSSVGPMVCMPIMVVSCGMEMVTMSHT